MIRRQATNYPLVALPSLTSSHLRIMQRPNPERGPHIVLANPSMACAVGYVEMSAGTDDTRSWPLKICPRSRGVWLRCFHSYTIQPHLVSSTTIRGPEDMLSSTLGQHILSYEPPCGFSIPPFDMYDGFSDLYDHMLHFNQVMILSPGNDRLLCKVFPASLKGLALAWFHKLPKGSINSFSKLWAAFVS